MATDLGTPVGAVVPSGMDQAETTAKDDVIEVAPRDATIETLDNTATDAGKRMYGPVCLYNVMYSQHNIIKQDRMKQRMILL